MFFRRSGATIRHDIQPIKRGLEINGDLVREARRVRRANPVTGERKSYQRVANELFELGFATANGTSFKREFAHKLLG